MTVTLTILKLLKMVGQVRTHQRFLTVVFAEASCQAQDPIQDRRQEQSLIYSLPPFSLLRDFSFQNTSEHFVIRFRQSYLIWEVCDVTAIELNSKE